MKKTKKALTMLLAVFMAVCLFAGCSTKKDTEPENAASQSTQAETPEEREITDMAGRTMTVPAEIKSAYSANPTAAIYIYTLVPDKLLGWNYELNDTEKSIILEQYHDLPNFGMGDAVNYEAVIAVEPTVAVSVGKINDNFISECDKLSESLGVPVFAVDSDLLNAPEIYRALGELFGEQERAEKLAEYAEKTFADVASMEIPEEEKVRIYYGNGEDSLETAPAGSQHAQIIDMVNGINVADLELGDGSRVQISAEQLLAWDPDVIVVNGEPKASLSGKSAAEKILTDPKFATLKAVKEEKVYGTPNAPFSWVDRPPGPNRIIGIRWLSGLIYPEYLNFNVDEEVKEFFSLFYHVDLTDEQLEKLYNGTI